MLGMEFKFKTLFVVTNSNLDSRDSIHHANRGQLVKGRNHASGHRLARGSTRQCLRESRRPGTSVAHAISRMRAGASLKKASSEFNISPGTVAELGDSALRKKGWDAL